MSPVSPVTDMAYLPPLTVPTTHGDNAAKLSAESLPPITIDIAQTEPTDHAETATQ